MNFRYGKRWLSPLTIVLAALASCTATKKTVRDDGELTANFILVNDVYEIAPLLGGREGGLSRVAALKKEYLEKNRNTFLVMAGDFLSPSVFNSLRFEGKPVRGRQMVDAMNAAGFDFAGFGNHEFDIREEELQERLDESSFTWISTNVYHQTKDGVAPFTSKGNDVPPYRILQLRDADGTRARVGIVSVCLPSNRADYVHYEDVRASLEKTIRLIRDSVDALIGLTHLQIADDHLLLQSFPEIDVILGGHEHDQRFEKEGSEYIVKALSNARSAFVVTVNINPRKSKVAISPQLRKIDTSTQADSLTQVVVNKWTSIANSSFAAQGFQPGRIILKEGRALDAREAAVRRGRTNFTDLIANALSKQYSNADVVLVNAGSIRVDDMLPLPLTEYDIIRALPFGGGMREVEIPGSFLKRILNTSAANKGNGGYLMHSNVLDYENGEWNLNNVVIGDNRFYRVAINDYMLSGKEINFEYFTSRSPEVKKVYPAPAQGSDAADLRLSIIHYLDEGGAVN